MKVLVRDQGKEIVEEKGDPSWKMGGQTKNEEAIKRKLFKPYIPPIPFA